MTKQKQETTIFVCGGSHKDNLVHYLEHIELEDGLNFEDFKKAGFTNFNEPVLYYHRRIPESDHYPVSFDITISKKNLCIESFCIFDEAFGQPHPCGKEEFKEVLKIIEHLQDIGIFKEKFND